jgi:hypothetical protein
MHNDRNHTCLSCGERIAPGLQGTGSLRCHDCRVDNVPLRVDLVEAKARPRR